MITRCYYLDLTKVLATLLVIVGHLYSTESTTRLYLYAFHMPLFFLISGVFHKDTGKINWRRYFQTLVWPALVCMFLHALVGLLFYHRTLGYCLDYYFVDLLQGKHDGIFWFLFALLWCKVFTDIWLRFRRTVIFLLLWAILLFVPILINKRLPLEMTQGLMALPFYVTGFFLRSYLRSRTPSVKYLIAFFVCLALTILLTCLHGRVSMKGVHFGQLARQFGIEPLSTSVPTRLAFLSGDVFLFYLNGLIGSIMVMSLALLPLPKWKAITPISQSLITAVGVQYLFIQPFVNHVGYDQPLWITIPVAAVIFALCYCMHLLLKPVYHLVQ